jgi:RNA polymerase-binding transcription factor DksA
MGSGEIAGDGGSARDVDDVWAAGIAVARAGAEVRFAALAAQVAELAEQQALTTHDDEHDPEGVTIGFERAQLQGLLAGAREEISALDRAASRLRSGAYGRCLVCGREIPDPRLEALPAAETCVSCSENSRRRR